MAKGLTAGGGMLLGMIFGLAFGHMVLGMLFGLILGAAVAAKRSPVDNTKQGRNG